MNIYFILCDELRSDALSCMGNQTIKTPMLDKLAEDSILFEKNYCNTPMCVPSRLSIATGRYAHSHGALDNMLSPQPDEVSLFSLLQEAGYYTSNHGKFHGNIAPERFGFHHSNVHGKEKTFPESTVSCFGISNREVRKNTTYKKNHGYISLVMSGTRPSDAEDVLDALVTRAVIDEAKLHKEKGEPCCIRYSIIDPHTPYLPAEPYASMYDPDTIDMPENLMASLEEKPILQRFFHQGRGFDRFTEEEYRKAKASYYGLVTHVDHHIGTFIDSLKEIDDYDDSLIIFTSDHGSMQGEHGYLEKWGHMYEPVLHTPLMIKLPQQQYKGKRCTSFTESVDIMPTILDILGKDIPQRVQGKSLLPYIKGEEDSHKKEIYAQYYCGALQEKPALCVRDDKYKYSYYGSGLSMEQRLLTDDPLRMSPLFDGSDVHGELYDMEKDPLEMVNLFDTPEYQSIKEQYQKKIDDFLQSLDRVIEKPFKQKESNFGMCTLLQGYHLENAMDGKKPPIFVP